MRYLEFSEAYKVLQKMCAPDILADIDPEWLWVAFGGAVLGLDYDKDIVWVGCVAGHGKDWMRGLADAANADGKVKYVGWVCKPNSFSDIVGDYYGATREPWGQYPGGAPKIKRMVKLSTCGRLGNGRL